MKELFGVAVVGYGGMGSWHTKRLLEMPDEFLLCGIYDIDPAQKPEYQREHHRRRSDPQYLLFHILLLLIHYN